MEKRLYKVPDILPCNCANQLLLLPGTTCELCMGIASEPVCWEEDGMDTEYGQYDQSYFEALERMFESFEFAA